MINLEKALQSNNETASLDFKREHNPKNKSNALGILKDIIAMANSGGGFILIGLDDNGLPYDGNTYVDEFMEEDVSAIQNNLDKYTGVKGLVKITKHATYKMQAKIVAIEVHETDDPIVIKLEGAYEEENSKNKKIMFNKGVCYFRHGAKSEPGDFFDLQTIINKKISKLSNSTPPSLAKLSFNIRQIGQCHRKFTFLIHNNGGTAHRALIEINTPNTNEYRTIKEITTFTTNSEVKLQLDWDAIELEHKEKPLPGFIIFRLKGYDSNGDKDLCWKSMTHTRDGYRIDTN